LLFLKIIPSQSRIEERKRKYKKKSSCLIKVIYDVVFLQIGLTAFGFHNLIFVNAQLI
jgi:hypothetical protein